MMDSTVKFDLTGNMSRVYIGDHSEIEHNVTIKGGCRIGEHVRIASGAVIEENCIIGDGTFIGHGVVMRPKTVIGKDCVIGHLTVFEGSTEVGHDTLIHAQCHITRGVIIGDKVFIAPGFVAANDNKMAHRRAHLWVEGQWYRPPRIESGVRIAVGVTCLPNVRIGMNAKIGAGTLVTKDVAENDIVIGVPGRVVGEILREERLI
jgi:acetyltransferase-like isoleucine patch superfamily enzyme